MSVYYLNAEDFSMQGNNMCINQPGIMLVMYTSKTCHHCDMFAPQFKQIPNSLVGVNVAICNVDNQNRQILGLAQKSSTPISAVPKFILYANGSPVADYTGSRTLNDIIRFIREVTQKLGNQGFQNNQGPPPQQQNQRSRNPAAQQPQATQQQPQVPKNYTVNSNTGVKEYETSYGLPYNAVNENEFLQYEQAYKSLK